MSNTISQCKAKDPNTCKYHGAEIRAERAFMTGDSDAYLRARRDMAANRQVGVAEMGDLLPTAETATVRDIINDRDRLIVNYPTESTFDSTWEEEGVPMPDEDGQDSDEFERNVYTRYLLNGTLAQRILAKVGRQAGRVTLTEGTEPYWLSEVTSDIDHDFKVEVDDEVVWDSKTAPAYVSPDSAYNRLGKDSFSLSYIGHLNEWLNS